MAMAERLFCYYLPVCRQNDSAFLLWQNHKTPFCLYYCSWPHPSVRNHNNCCLFFSFLQFFHFSSRAFPPLEGHFSGRIQWRGSPAKGEASIALINSTLNDNGTYTCSVRNPPDVHGNPNSHIVLTVMPKSKLLHILDSNYYQAEINLRLLMEVLIFSHMCLLINNMNVTGFAFECYLFLL